MAEVGDGVADLAGLVAAEQRAWDEPVVCLAVFGDAEPQRIAERIDAWCTDALGSGARRALFYRVSQGCVAGLELVDGRSVVVKVQRGDRDRAYLDACASVKEHLSTAGFPCPRPIAGPSRLGEAWATAESFQGEGAKADPHDPAVRRVIAGSLADLVRLARPFVADPAFKRAWFGGLPDDRVFPRPHSPLFDFEATRDGAEWIEALAARAREQRRHARGTRVIGHFDWRAEHLRFDADGRVVASYDWDSLHAELETVLVGAAAHAFTADWEREDLERVPTFEELVAFVDDYEAARGARFDAAERATVAASCVYSLAYTARCNHALSPLAAVKGDFRPLLRAHGQSMLDSGL